LGIDREFIRRLLGDMEEAMRIIGQQVSKPFEDLSRPERSEIKYYIIVLVEALTTLALHIARNAYGARPETPVQAFSVLRDRGLINRECFEELVKLVRLRNLLVHRYWVIVDERIYEDARRDFKGVRRLMERVRVEYGL